MSTTDHVTRRQEEYQAHYDQLSARIEAIYRDLGRTLDGEQRLVLDQRLQDLTGERERVVAQMAFLEQHIDDIQTGKIELPGLPELEPAPGQSPYQGLQYFDIADAPNFFGRETLTAELAGYLGNHRFLAVVGASGSGKSSLVRAGLIPALQHDQPLEGGVLPPEGSDRWVVHITTPTARPLESLAASLTRHSESVTATATLIDDLSKDPRSLHLSARRLVDSGNRLLLVVDQFEELFTLCRDKEERRAFVDSLLYAARDDGMTTVVIALRADFYSYCSEYPNLRQALERDQKYIGSMSMSELRKAIEEPARRNSWEFEPGLVDELLRDVGATENRQPEPGALPLLSHALLETWKRRRGRTLTLGGYAESGGVQGAISKTAESVYRQRLDLSQQGVARTLFIRLTEFGEGVQETRRRVKLSELRPKDPDDTTIADVLQTLADARLITVSADEVEVAHEALIREWPTLQEWLATDREGLRTYRRLTLATEEWIEFKRDPALLYGGSQLAQALDWAAQHQTELNEREREFIAASQQKQEKALRSQRQRRLTLAGVMGLALVLATAVTILGTQSALQRKELHSHKLAGDARTNLDSDPELSILLAQRALQTANTTAAQEVLRQALQRGSKILKTLPFSYTELSKVEFSPDHRLYALSDVSGKVDVRDSSTGLLVHSFHSGQWVTDLEFSPTSDDLLAAGDVSGTVRIWDVSSGDEFSSIQVGPLTNTISSIAFSPDGKSLITSSYDYRLRVWDLETQREVTWADDILGDNIASSHDGHYLVIGGFDGELSLLDSSLQKVVESWSGHEGEVMDVAFSPDDHLIASVGQDKKVKVWEVSDLSSKAPSNEFLGHDSTIWDVTFSDDGNCLATAGYDHRSIVWRVSGERVATLLGAGQPLFGVDFAADNADAEPLPNKPCGAYLKTVSSDGTLQTWNMGAGTEYETLTGHAAGVEAVGIAPLQHRFVTADDDGVVLVWDDAPPTHLNMKIHEERINDLAVSPDEQLIATASWDGTSKLLEILSGRVLTSTNEERDEDGQIVRVRLNSVAFRPSDGSQFVTAGSDGIVRLWDCLSGTVLDQWPIHQGGLTEIYSVSFSPDGSRIVTAGEDGFSYVWDPNSGRKVGEFNHKTPVASAAFTPDGSFVITGDVNGKLRNWSVESEKLVWEAAAHQGPINAIEFSSDGKYFATAGSDKRAIVWNGATGEPISILEGSEEAVTDARFMPTKDGLALVTTGGDNTVRIYLVHAADLARFAGTRVTRALTPDECKRYLDEEGC